jgi:hypothetical protein
MLEFAENVALEGQEDSTLFPITQTALEALDGVQEKYAFAFSVAYIIKVCAYQGFKPEFAECVICGRDLEFSAEEIAAFSIREGGSLCKQCNERLAGEREANPHARPHNEERPPMSFRPEREARSGEILTANQDFVLISWIHLLIRSKFSELESALRNAGFEKDSTRIDKMLFNFISEWIWSHLGLELKSMPYAGDLMESQNTPS